VACVHATAFNVFSTQLTVMPELAVVVVVVVVTPVLVLLVKYMYYILGVAPSQKQWHMKA